MLARSLFASALALALTFGAAGCGGPRNYRVTGTQRDPGADAQIQIENIAGGNHLMTITVRHLTPAARLGTGNTVFMVWIRAGSAPAALASELEYADDTREGTATATTPHDRFTVFVTAERNANVTTASDFVVFTQNVEL